MIKVASGLYIGTLAGILLLLVFAGALLVIAGDPSVGYWDAVFLQIGTATSLGMRVGPDTRVGSNNDPGTGPSPHSFLAKAVTAVTAVVGLPIFLFCSLEAIWWVAKRTGQVIKIRDVGPTMTGQKILMSKPDQ